MSKKAKRIERLKELPSDYTWDEACTLLKQLSFEQLEGSGSRVKFVLDSNAESDDDILLSLHKPHPGNVMQHYAVKILHQALIDNKLI